MPATTVRDKIEAVLDAIRPAVRQDGGEVELVEFDEAEGRVSLRLLGACGTCPHSVLTLKAGIEQRLRIQIPEVKSVDAVTV